MLQSGSGIYFLTSWLYFAFVYATIFEKPSFFTSQILYLIQSFFSHTQRPVSGMVMLLQSYMFENLIHSRSVSARYQKYYIACMLICLCMKLKLCPISRNVLKHIYYFNFTFENVTTVQVFCCLLL